MFLSSLSCCWQCSGILWSCQNYIFFLLFTNSQYKPFEGANKENSSNKRNIKDVQQQCPPPLDCALLLKNVDIVDPQRLNNTSHNYQAHNTFISINYPLRYIILWMNIYTLKKLHQWLTILDWKYFSSDVFKLKLFLIF